MSKSNWFYINYATHCTRLAKKTGATQFHHAFPIRTKIQTFQSSWLTHSFFHALHQPHVILLRFGSLYCYLCPFWLGRVITSVLVLPQSIENRYKWIIYYWQAFCFFLWFLWYLEMVRCKIRKCQPLGFIVALLNTTSIRWFITGHIQRGNLAFIPYWNSEHSAL